VLKKTNKESKKTCKMANCNKSWIPASKIFTALFKFRGAYRIRGILEYREWMGRLQTRLPFWSIMQYSCRNQPRLKVTKEAV